MTLPGMSGCYLLNSFDYLLFILVLVCFIAFHFFSSFTDYKTDPYSEGDPCKSICCRADLKSQNASPSGCYDTKVICIAVKQYCNLFLLLFLAHLRLPMPAALFFIFLLVQVTDFLMAKDFHAEAVNGPTTQGGLLPFMWDNFSNISHQGLPPSYNFTFVRMQPLLFKP